MKDIKYIIGLILVLLASIACGISAFLWIIAIPVFLIGVVLILLSKKSLRTRLLSAFAPFVLIVATASIIWHLVSKTTPETYLIPAGFQGNFRVVYGESCGVQPAEEDGRRVLQIPPSGLLIVNAEFEAGVIDHEYYFVDNAGKRTALQTVYDRAGKTGVLLEGSGSMGGSMPDGSSSSESPLAIEYSDFFVVNPNAAEAERSGSYLDSLTTATVEDCRKK